MGPSRHEPLLNARRGFKLLLALAPCGLGLAISLDRLPDSAQKVLLAKRLGQKLHSAGLHGAHRHGDVGLAGDEMMGILNSARISSRWRSRPFRPGSPTSSTRHEGPL